MKTVLLIVSDIIVRVLSKMDTSLIRDVLIAILEKLEAAIVESKTQIDDVLLLALVRKVKDVVASLGDDKPAEKS